MLKKINKLIISNINYRKNMGNCQTACCSNDLQEIEVNTTIEGYFKNHKLLEDALDKGKNNLEKVLLIQSWVRGNRVRSQVVREIYLLQSELNTLREKQKQLVLKNNQLQKEVKDLQSNYQSQRQEDIGQRNKKEQSPLNTDQQDQGSLAFSKISNQGRSLTNFSSYAVKLKLDFDQDKESQPKDNEDQPSNLEKDMDPVDFKVISNKETKEVAEFQTPPKSRQSRADPDTNRILQIPATNKSVSEASKAQDLQSMSCYGKGGKDWNKKKHERRKKLVQMAEKDSDSSYSSSSEGPTYIEAQPGIVEDDTPADISPDQMNRLLDFTRLMKSKVRGRLKRTYEQCVSEEDYNPQDHGPYQFDAMLNRR